MPLIQPRIGVLWIEAWDHATPGEILTSRYHAVALASIMSTNQQLPGSATLHAEELHRVLAEDDHSIGVHTSAIIELWKLANQYRPAVQPVDLSAVELEDYLKELYDLHRAEHPPTPPWGKIALVLLVAAGSGYAAVKLVNHYRGHTYAHGT